ncbi:hypothetical protein L6164_031803 [Bauhinia variegata]|nr:hypothetical protein L6164_031803 [Bauhinia variegata]
MRRKTRPTFFAIVLFAVVTLRVSRTAVDIPWYSESNFTASTKVRQVVLDNNNIDLNQYNHQTRRVSSVKDSVTTVSALLPDWEILIIVSPETPLSGEDYHCLFPNNAKTPAKYSGVLPFTNQTTFKCYMPESVRRRRMFNQPVLTKASENESPSPTPELLRWNFLVYESFSTDSDVVLFAKGINPRRGTNRAPRELRCVFGDGVKSDVVRTPVTSTAQEIFRCPHPNTAELGFVDGEEKIKVSIEFIGQNLVVPSVAYYSPRFNLAKSQPNLLLCACTMVYNVAKFLREWVMYHSKIGVEKFILYDNGSDDDLENTVKELNDEGYDVSTFLWIWPKTQEAGFSHSVQYLKDTCSWVMYMDVDEFVFDPTWENPWSNDMLKSLLPRVTASSSELEQRPGGIGQVLIKCYEFGPSGQRVHPVEGVTQGYTCRRQVDERHKSIVLLDAVDDSLLNVIHHFEMKEGFRSKQMNGAVVNHYKYQAWPEFRNKFRRRVSAYVVDWREAGNPKSKDRTPGLGFEAVEPRGWTERFCEIKDERLKFLTQRWFGSETREGYRMAWQIR